MTTKLLCPTRGGEASYPNQDSAISLAIEQGAELIFLYVSNVNFLDLTAAPKVFDIETELDEMGDFLLAMAQERASQAGIEADAVVRRGEFRETLQDIIEEYIDKLSEEMCSETGAQFIVVHQGEIVKFCTP